MPVLEQTSRNVCALQALKMSFLQTLKKWTVM